MVIFFDLFSLQFLPLVIKFSLITLLPLRRAFNVSNLKLVSFSLEISILLHGLILEYDAPLFHSLILKYMHLYMSPLVIELALHN